MPLIRIIVDYLYQRLIQFLYGLYQFRICRYMMMPYMIIFYKGDSFSFDCMGDNHTGLFSFKRDAVQDFCQRLNIMSVHMLYAPAKCAKFLFQRICGADIFCPTGNLKFVKIDDCNKIVQLIM